MKVTILQPVRHDGKRYTPGDVADISKTAAQALIACGAAEEGGTLKKAAPAVEEPAAPEAPAAEAPAQASAEQPQG